MSQAKPRQTEPAPPRVPPIMILSGIMVALTIAGVSWTWQMLSDPTALPIRRVMVEGEFKHLTPEHVQTVVVRAVHGGFFAVKVNQIRDELLTDAWIRDANISRVWPDGLRVSITEQVPVARWGDYGLLNARADIFVPPPEDLPRDLPQLSGPLGSEIEVLKRFEYIRAQLAEVGLVPLAVSQSDRQAWTVVTAGRREILLGRRDLEARLARFKWGYKRGLNAAWERIGHVDMRYPNGFAVGERTAVVRNG